jgi:hypothetical protein
MVGMAQARLCPPYARPTLHGVVFDILVGADAIAASGRDDPRTIAFATLLPHP